MILNKELIEKYSEEGLLKKISNAKRNRFNVAGFRVEIESPDEWNYDYYAEISEIVRDQDDRRFIDYEPLEGISADSKKELFTKIAKIIRREIVHG